MSRENEPGSAPLLPAIREREQELKRMLQEARERSAAAVAEAEREAAARLRAAREAAPAAIEEQRREAAAVFEAEAAAGESVREEAARELERAGARRLEQAVQAILAAVWPGGRP